MSLSFYDGPNCIRSHATQINDNNNDEQFFFFQLKFSGFCYLYSVDYCVASTLGVCITRLRLVAPVYCVRITYDAYNQCTTYFQTNEMEIEHKSKKKMKLWPMTVIYIFHFFFFRVLRTSAIFFFFCLMELNVMCGEVAHQEARMRSNRVVQPVTGQWSCSPWICKRWERCEWLCVCLCRRSAALFKWLLFPLYFFPRYEYTRHRELKGSVFKPGVECETADRIVIILKI